MSWMLSKARLQSYLQCPKRLHLEIHHRDLIHYGAATERLFKTGHQVGGVAQKVLAPGGVLIDYDPGLQQAVAETARLLSGNDATLYEATFQYQNIQIRADLLVLAPGKIDVIEVKAAASVKEPNYTDLAIQYWVMRECGYQPTSLNLAYINNQFIYQGDGNYAGLFTLEDLTEDIQPLLPKVPEWIEKANEIVAGSEPEIAVGAHCTKPYVCPFIEHCSTGLQEIVYPTAKFPGLKKPERIKLIEKGYVDARNIPIEEMASGKQRDIWSCYQSGEPLIPQDLKSTLRALEYPRYYLDFETIGFAVPVWQDTRPYQALPFQWSCHVESGPGKLRHCEFLDSSGNPPMRAFSESLIEALGAIGPIVVYSHYERTILRRLAERFPEYREAFQRIIERLYDLHIPIKNMYYHRDLNGRSSIKKVLPTLVPELSYDGLDGVQDGLMAQDAYLTLIENSVPGEELRAVEHSLLEYCKLDTLAMVKLVERLSS